MMSFSHNFTIISALLPRGYEQKEAKMACPKRLGKPRANYSQNCIKRRSTTEENGLGSEFKIYISYKRRSTWVGTLHTAMILNVTFGTRQTWVESKLCLLLILLKQITEPLWALVFLSREWGC